MNLRNRIRLPGPLVSLSTLLWVIAVSLGCPAGAAAPAGQPAPPPPVQWPRGQEFSAQPDSSTLISSSRCKPRGPITSISLSRRSFQTLKDRELMAKRIYAEAGQFDGQAIGKASLDTINSALDAFDSVASVEMRCWERSVELAITGYGQFQGINPVPLRLGATVDATGFHSVVVARLPTK